MKIQLLLAASAIALAAGSANAMPATVVTGYVDMGYNYYSQKAKETYQSEGLSNYTYTDKMSGFFADAAASLPVTDLVGAQFDIGYSNFALTDDESYNNGSSHSHYGYHGDGYTATGHAFARTDQFLAGGFVGFSSSVYNSQLLGGGVEGQYYLGPWTFQGAFGLAKWTNYSYNGNSPSFWALRGDVRYFFCENLYFGAHVGYMDGTFHYGTDTERGPQLLTFGIDGEYQYKKTPYAAFVKYEHGDGKNNYTYGSGSGYDHYTYSGDSVKIGLRWTFGGSLKNRDRHGASLNSLRDTMGGEFGQTGEYFGD